MSVDQLESALQALPPEERRKFIHWLDEHRDELIDAADDLNLTEEQKAELLRRREEALAHPELLEPWDGTVERVRGQLNFST
jgi:recombinational DNA repair ATPase RecF